MDSIIHPGPKTQVQNQVFKAFGNPAGKSQSNLRGDDIPQSGHRGKKRGSFWAPLANTPYPTVPRDLIGRVDTTGEGWSHK